MSQDELAMQIDKHTMRIPISLEVEKWERLLNMVKHSIEVDETILDEINDQIMYHQRQLERVTNG
jgi:hypothetical protein